MKYFLFAFSSLIMISSTISFKSHQLDFIRVSEAYKNQETQVKHLLKDCGVKSSKFQVYLRAFKDESELELWVKDENQTKFTLLKTYDICGSSGSFGPKRVQGDYQVPEGFYHIDRFNPESKFHLSLGVNYPNASDMILSDPEKPGGDIFIHGSCQTVGCLPITDEWIEELYVFCVEAHNGGQTNIPVTFFPAKFQGIKLQWLKNGYPELKEHFGLWDDLNQAYHLFNENLELPQVQFLEDGRHSIKR